MRLPSPEAPVTGRRIDRGSWPWRIVPAPKPSLAVLTASCLAFVDTLHAENWPAWRGPQATGVSSEKGLADELVDRREHCLEAADAEPQRGDADHPERSHLPQRRDGDAERRPEPWSVDRKRRADVEIGRWLRQQSTAQADMSTLSPVTYGTTVRAMNGTGILKALDFKGTESRMRDVQKDDGTFGLTRDTPRRRCCTRERCTSRCCTG